MDYRVACWCGEGFFWVAEAKKDADHEGEGHCAIDEETVHHGLRDFSRCVVDFVAHVEDSVEAAEGKDGGEEANAPLHAFVGPAAEAEAVGCEDEFCAGLGCHDGQDDDPDEEEDQVCENSEEFQAGKNAAGEDVDDDWDGEECPCEESAVPSLVDVSWIVQDNQSLDHRT